MDTEHFSESICKKPISAIEFVDVIMGSQIGTGMSRNVYNCKLDNSIVIKHEVGNCFQNIIEWEIWNRVVGTSLEKWFVPCLSISPNGLFLIQKRATPLQYDKYPKKMPAFFNDTKYQNYGMVGNNFVCLDYGTINLKSCVKSKKLKKVEWIG